ncbi:MAG: 30S ribosomal protein S16 [Gammaproteobacteria bacterium]|nr:30S ribosomal protein S16 [Gammaproteobacteria bacterium]MCY4218725.1 30S ribosomal protein S16 [Gammaproteobacteria bacterium]MCY4275432.1 30S ribosomal protein S16 [Gammaproteobacteria bacterium]
MVKIRLSRGGSKKRPFYTVLVADQRRSNQGKFIERVGHFNPMSSDSDPSSKLVLNLERVDHWLAKGAKMSDRVNDLYKRAKAAEI